MSPQLLQAFSLDCPTHLVQKGIDVRYLFGNLSEVIQVSEKFLISLQPRGDSGTADNFFFDNFSNLHISVAMKILRRFMSRALDQTVIKVCASKSVYLHRIRSFVKVYRFACAQSLGLEPVL